MPAPLDEYKVSPYNFKVDRKRVARLVSDALSAARRDVDLSAYRLVWIVVGAYSGAAVVSAENAHAGHVVHDLLHALGGASGGERAVPDLYDFELQSNPQTFPMRPEHFAIHAGPWDIMSQHFIEWKQSPPAPSSFTRLQLGWIGAEQVINVKPGETREITLKPLASGAAPLVARVDPGGRRYLLIENRQRTGMDVVLPAAGLVVLEVDTSRAEGTDIVRTVNANPSVAWLYGAPFVPGPGERRVYENARAGVAIAPLALEADGAMRAIVTTRERIGTFVPDAGGSGSR